MAIKDWSTTASSNNSAPPDGFPENMAPSAVNDAARETMAQVRSWYEDAEWVNRGYTYAYVATTQFKIAGADVSSIYHVGRRVRAVGSSTGTIYGIITVSSFSSDTTVTVSWDSGTLANETLQISHGATSKVSSSAPSASLIDDDAVTTAKVADNAVTLAKLEDGTAGDILYYASAGAPTRLAKGTDAEVLTLASGVPSWAAAAGGMWEFVSSTSATAVSAIDLPVADSGYDYKFVFHNVQCDTDNHDLHIRTSSDGGSTFAAATNNYGYIFVYNNSASPGLVDGDGGLSTVIKCYQNNGTAVNEHLNVELTVYNPGDSAAYTRVHGEYLAGTTATRIRYGWFSGWRRANEAVDYIRFDFDTGSFEAAGTIETWRREIR